MDKSCQRVLVSQWVVADLLLSFSVLLSIQKWIHSILKTRNQINCSMFIYFIFIPCSVILSFIHDVTVAINALLSPDSKKYFNYLA